MLLEPNGNFSLRYDKSNQRLRVYVNSSTKTNFYSFIPCVSNCLFYMSYISLGKSNQTIFEVGYISSGNTVVNRTNFTSNSLANSKVKSITFGSNYTANITQVYIESQFKPADLISSQVL